MLVTVTVSLRSPALTFTSALCAPLRPSISVSPGSALLTPCGTPLLSRPLLTLLHLALLHLALALAFCPPLGLGPLLSLPRSTLFGC